MGYGLDGHSSLNGGLEMGEMGKGQLVGQLVHAGPGHEPGPGLQSQTALVQVSPSVQADPHRVQANGAFQIPCGSTPA